MPSKKGSSSLILPLSQKNLRLRGNYRKCPQTQQLSCPLSWPHLLPPLPMPMTNFWPNWQMRSQKTRWPWVTRASCPVREHLAKSDSVGGETNLTGIWAGSTALFIDAKLFASLRALWGPLKMFGKPQSQSCCVLREDLWASENWAAERLPPQKPVKGAAPIQAGCMRVSCFVFKRCPSSGN